MSSTPKNVPIANQHHQRFPKNILIPFLHFQKKCPRFPKESLPNSNTGLHEDRSAQTHEHTRLNMQRCLKITFSLAGLNRFVSKSGVQMVKEGDIRLSSPKKQIHRAA